ncbi:MAG TPA: hypothetical protein PKC37_10585, partial [Kaistella sp.]|nr:hypothetical protein [Kaistella sp.]
FLLDDSIKEYKVNTYKKRNIFIDINPGGTLNGSISKVSDLANERKRYLKRMKEISESYGCSLEELFSKIIEKFDFDNLQFIRSVTEEYGFDLWSMIPFKNDE